MLDKITISGNPFDHVLTMAESDQGIWTTLKGSSVIELWDTETLSCKIMYDVSCNRIIARKGVSCIFNRIKLNMKKVTNKI